MSIFNFSQGIFTWCKHVKHIALYSGLRSLCNSKYEYIGGQFLALAVCACAFFAAQVWSHKKSGNRRKFKKRKGESSRGKRDLLLREQNVRLACSLWWRVPGQQELKVSGWNYETIFDRSKLSERGQRDLPLPLQGAAKPEQRKCWERKHTYSEQTDGGTFTKTHQRVRVSNLTMHTDMRRLLGTQRQVRISAVLSAHRQAANSLRPIFIQLW